MDSPVTREFLNCLSIKIEELETHVALAGFVVRANNDATCNNLQFTLGQMGALKFASDPRAVLAMLETPEGAEVAA